MWMGEQTEKSEGEYGDPVLHANFTVNLKVQKKNSKAY